MAYETDDGNVVCEQCGNEYKKVATHWVQSKSCNYPELDQLRKDILVGSLMGDGAIQDKEMENQSIKVNWSSKEQCQWLDEELGWMSTGVTLVQTAEEAAEKNGGTDFNGSTVSSDPADWSDAYRVRARSHPFITEMTTGWYGDSGYEKKVWPEDIYLSPTVLLLWFVGDGSYKNDGTNRRIAIALNNEEGNEEKIDQYFQRVDQPEPSNWYSSGSYRARWNIDQSKSLFEYMSQSPLMDDGPPRGFEYKFPEEYGGTGSSMADLTPKT